MTDGDPLGSSLDDPWRALRRAGSTLGLALLVLVVALVVVERTASDGAGLEGLWGRIRWPQLGLAWVLLTGALVAIGLRWRELMPPEVWPPAWGLALIQSAASLLAYAFPGPVGEFAAAWLAKRQYGVPVADGLASSFAGRLLGLLIAGVLSLLTWVAFDLPVPGSMQAPVGFVAAGLGLGAVAGIAVAARPDLVSAVVSRTLRPLAGAGLIGRMVAAIDRGLSAITLAIGGVARRGVVAWVRASAWATLGHAVGALGIAASAWAIGADPSLPGIVFSYATLVSGGILLYAVPGSQVASDALLVGLLVVTAGLGLSDAIAVAFLIRIQSLSVLCLGAGALVVLQRTPPESP